MIVLKENTVAWNLLRIIGLCGEFPVYSIGILGNRREYRKRICEMQDEQTYKNPYTDRTITVKALTVSSYGRTKTVRILKNATELLRWVGYYEPYADRFLNSGFHGDEDHLDRNHRVAETAALFLRAGYHVETDKSADMEQTEKDTLYLAHIFKGVNNEPDPKSRYTRVTGGFRARDSCFAVYNARDRAMKWVGRGELKTRLLLREKFGCDLTGAILLGKDYETGMRTALRTDSAGSKTPFYRDWDRLFFAPLDENGAALLKIISEKNVSERILEMMFDPASRSYGNGTFNYHAKINSVFIYSFLDSDLKGIIEFKNGLRADDRAEVLCYDFQTDFVREYFSDMSIKITNIPMEAVREILH